jgi:hypothetical protein
VALAAGCIRDAAGNNATFGATAPGDFAAPILLTVTDTNGSTDGQAEAGDTLTFGFSEAISSAPSSVTLLVNDAGSSDTLQVIGLLNIDSALGSDYASKDLTFEPSAVVKSGSTLVVTLGTCSTSGQCSSRALVATSPTLVFVPAITITDVAGQGARGSVTLTDKALF